MCDPSWPTYSHGWTAATPLTFDWQTRAQGWVPWRDKPATAVGLGDSTYSVSHSTTRGATNYLWVSLALAGGLQATYYTGVSGDYTGACADATLFGKEGANRFVQVDNTIDFSVTSAAPTPLSGKTTWVVWTPTPPSPTSSPFIVAHRVPKVPALWLFRSCAFNVHVLVMLPCARIYEQHNSSPTPTP